MCDCGVMTRDSHTSETMSALNPTNVMLRGWTRSVSFPTYGASTIDMTAIGTSSRAAWVGERPRTSWA